MSVAVAVSQDSAYPPRITIEVTGLTVGNVVSVYRSLNSVRTLVRGAESMTMTDTTLVRTDAEQPFGVPITYVVTVADVDTATSTPFTSVLVDGVAAKDTKCVLSDAITGLAAEVTVSAWPDKTTDLGSTRFNVGGRTIVWSPPGASAESNIELLTDTETARENLQTLLDGATSKIVLLRQGGPYNGVDGWYAVMSWVESRRTQRGIDESRVWTLNVLNSGGWAPGLLASGSTLADIQAVYAGLTLADLAGDFGTLLDIEVFDWAGEL